MGARESEEASVFFVSELCDEVAQPRFNPKDTREARAPASIIRP